MTMQTILILSLSFTLVACNSTTIPVETPSEETSFIEISPNNIADGITASEVIVVLKTSFGLPISGLNIALHVSGKNNALVPCSITDAQGRSSCRIYSTFAEVKKVTVKAKITLSRNVYFHSKSQRSNLFSSNDAHLAH